MARNQDQQQPGRAAADDVVAAMVAHDLAALKSARGADDDRLQDMLGLWDEVGKVGRSPDYPDLLGRPTLRERIVEARRALAGSSWRFALPALPAAALAAVGGLLLMPRPVHYDAGPQARSITLPDSSTVILSPGSRLDYAQTDGARRTKLIGEATFSIAHDAAHPFHVSTGDADIKVLGTRFTLSRRKACTQLSVLSGTVQMRSPSMPVRRLTAGEESVAVDNGESYAACLRGAAEAPQLRWTYVDAPLSTVLADVGRFYRGKIALRSSRAATERVTMSITPEQIATMIDALPQIADVTLTSDADGTILIDARHGASSE